MGVSRSPAFPVARPAAFPAIGHNSRALFTPADLGEKLLGRVKFWDASTYTITGAGISSITDTVAEVAYTQGTNSLRPTVSGAWANFNGLQFLTRTGIYGTASTPLEVWALVRQDALVADTQGRFIFAQGGDGTGKQSGCRRVVSGGANLAGALIGNGSSNITFNETTVDFSGRHVIRLRVEAAQAAVDIDGTSSGFVAVTKNILTDRARIGANAAATAAAMWNGGITELFVTQPLESDEALAVDPYNQLKLAA